MTDRLFTTAEVGVRLAISRDSVLRLIHRGDLRVVDVSTGARPRLRVRADDVAAFIDAHTAQAEEPA